MQEDHQRTMLAAISTIANFYETYNKIHVEHIIWKNVYNTHAIVRLLRYLIEETIFHPSCIFLLFNYIHKNDEKSREHRIFFTTTKSI